VSDRTPEQRFADQFDADLYRLIRHADDRRDDTKWYAVFERLTQARLLVLSMMHPEDREATNT
jgi:hypothetical protein